MNLDLILTIGRYAIIVIGALWSIRALIKQAVPLFVRAAAKPISQPILQEVRQLQDMIEEHDQDIDAHKRDAYSGK